jgi:hypothetical protein
MKIAAIRSSFAALATLALAVTAALGQAPAPGAGGGFDDRSRAHDDKGRQAGG